MKTRFISHNPTNRRVILIFSGWSTTPDFYSDLHTEGWDIIIVYDYTDKYLNTDILKEYSTVFILAWSLGVRAAELVAKDLLEIGIAAAFAVNGTPFPADDQYGIPPFIYDGTEANLTFKNLMRFRNRMDAGSLSGSKFKIESDADDDDAILRLKKELRNLHDGTESIQLPWKRAYISDNDRIFPVANQIIAWSSFLPSLQIIHKKAGHYLPLDEIIANITPDHVKIAERFSKAVSTYDSNASAQDHIASHLAELIPQKAKIKKNLKMLEIGPGSGRLTHHLRSAISPEHVTFIDLYPLQSFNLFQNEEYVVGDAEEWIEKVGPEEYDIIASSSVIQWFADPKRFFRNVKRALRPKGFFLCSTFLPGNLQELDVLRPSPLLYHSREEIETMLKPLFSDIFLEEERIVMDFKSPKEALLHLKLTGVGGGSSASTRNLLTRLPANPKLTFKTLYIRAHNNFK